MFSYSDAAAENKLRFINNYIHQDALDSVENNIEKLKSLIERHKKKSTIWNVFSRRPYQTYLTKGECSTSWVNFMYHFPLYSYCLTMYYEPSWKVVAEQI